MLPDGRGEDQDVSRAEVTSEAAQPTLAGTARHPMAYKHALRCEVVWRRTHAPDAVTRSQAAPSTTTRVPQSSMGSLLRPHNDARLVVVRHRLREPNRASDLPSVR
eukprot:7282362-Prymnesium_polylepis.1